jgi:hypothetical protein
LSPNSHRARRCLQEFWGQVTSIYLNSWKQYKWLRFSEDCLYLNVYAPIRAGGDPLLPVSTLSSIICRLILSPHCPAQASAIFLFQVMVWFPGGAFLIGAASTYDGSELSAHEKVVIVVLQHRLGIFGFLRWAGPRAESPWLWMEEAETGGRGVAWAKRRGWQGRGLMLSGGDQCSIHLSRVSLTLKETVWFPRLGLRKVSQGGLGTLCIPPSSLGH